MHIVPYLACAAVSKVGPVRLDLVFPRLCLVPLPAGFLPSPYAASCFPYPGALFFPNSFLLLLIVFSDPILSFFRGLSSVENPLCHFHQISNGHFPQSFLLI